MPDNRYVRILLLLILLGAVITIVAEMNQDQTLVYVYKPMTTIFILVLAWVGGRTAGPYRTRILLGLLFSLAGDVFLMWPDQLFLAGLVSFLIAHIAYITAFATGRQTRFTLTVLPFAIFGLLIYALLLPGLGDLRWPVLIYIAVILTMGWQAVERTRSNPLLGWLAPVGAVLFILSDATLAWNKFHTPLEWSRIVVLGTYYPAQMLIALTVRREVQLSAPDPDNS
ncbi:MAG: lysoplasmalogenase [FCB group bacterium]|nr:lysoplasmalogenase [FCB group bacterium]